MLPGFLMTKKDSHTDDTEFWLTHSDSIKASTYLIVHWLAYVYPTSQSLVEKTLEQSLPDADNELATQCFEVFANDDIVEHVEALRWASNHLSKEQLPSLIAICWRLLLADHDLPAHLPLAMRILSRLLYIPEASIHAIGEQVLSEFSFDEQRGELAPLLPVEPRYLDRIEWRLHGNNATRRLNVVNVDRRKRNLSGYYGFGLGTLFGVAITITLVWGPLKLGRIRVPVVQYEPTLDNEQAAAAIAADASPAAIEELPEVPADIEADAPPDSAEPAVATLEDPVATGEEITAVPDEPITPAADDSESVTATAQPDGIAGRVLMEVTASVLNVRTAPDVGSDILIKLARGARVWAYPEQTEGLWMYLSVQGEIGYASARFLAEVGP